MDAREWVIGVDQTSSGGFHNIIRLHTFTNTRRTLEFNVGIISNMQKQKVNGDTNRIAGIVVVREQEDGTFRVLSLLPGAEAVGKSGKPFYRFYGTYDIPKGHSKVGESSMAAALREADEEAKYSADNLDFRWGNKSILVNGRRGKKGVFFVAHSDVDPVITRNPENGMLEHGGFKWVSFDEMESKTSNFWFGDAIRWARKIVESSNDNELNETLLRNLIRQILAEASPRQNKDKRVLYHINKYRPARPQLKTKYMQEWDSSAIDPDTGEKTGNMVNVPGTNTWERYWLKDSIKSGVFLTPNPLDIAMFHGRIGNVYAYMVPEWVIAKAGGIHRYDWGSEILISEDIWNEAGIKGGPPYEKTGEIEFLGKSMDAQELRDSMKSSDYGRGYTRKATTPSWLSDEELAAWEKQRKAFKLPGLRKTKHPKDVIKMLKPAEVKAALAAFEEEYKGKPDTFIHYPNDRKGFKVPGKTSRPTPQDQELINLLLKRDEELSESNEAMIRHYVREVLLESKSGEPDMTKYVDDLEDEIFTLLFQKSTFDHLQSQAANSNSTAILNTSLFDEYDNIDKVHLEMSVNDSNSANVQAAYVCDPKERNLSNLVLSISIPRDYPQVEGFQDWLSAELADALSHEIQHSCDTSEMLGGDIPEGEAKWESLENIEKYFASNAETRGHIAGILGRSRRTGLDPEGLLDRDMSTIMSKAIDHGYTESELTPILQRIYDKWFTRLGDLS